MTMSKQKHTPGPWRKENDGAGEFGIHADAGRTWKFVAMVTANGLGSAVVTEAEAEANARLIAAAPDLLAALQAITPHTFGHNKVACKGLVRDPENCDVCKAIWAARDAIAKATGA